MRLYSQVSGAFFSVLALLQLARVLNGWPVQVAGLSIPVWVSGCAFVIASGLAFWAFQSARGSA